MNAVNETDTDSGSLIRPRVFLSYSRVQRERAEELRDLLREHGFDAYLDLHDIAPGEPWRERVGGLIQSAEKVVFLISPQAVASEICAWEVDHAEGLGKSVLPVMVCDTDMAAIPGRLQRLNFIFMRDVEELRGALDSLVTSLKVDLAWEREKTRINDDALTWEGAARPRRLLIYDENAIRHAELWRDARPNSSPPPTPLQLAFIADSRAHRTRRQRRTLAAVVAVALITGAAAIIAFLQRQAAVTNATQAEQRAAILSLDAAKSLARSGETDAALLMGLDASDKFPGDLPPDNLVAAFHDILERDASETTFDVPSDSEAFDAGPGVLVHSPTTGKAYYFEPDTGLRPVGEIAGRIVAAGDLQPPDGTLFVAWDGAHARVARLPSDHSALDTVGETPFVEPPEDISTSIGADGLVLVGASSDFSLFDPSQKRWRAFPDSGLNPRRVTVDRQRRRFVLDRDDVPWSVGADLSLVRADNADSKELKAAACLGPAVFSVNAGDAIAALREEAEAQWLDHCSLVGGMVLRSYFFSTSAGGELQTAVLDITDRPAGRLLDIVTPGTDQRASWRPGDGDALEVGVSKYQDLLIYRPGNASPETVAMSSPIAFHRLLPNGRLLILREAVHGNDRDGSQPLLSLMHPPASLSVFQTALPEDESAGYADNAPTAFLRPQVCGGETSVTWSLPTMRLTFPPNDLETHEGALGTRAYQIGIVGSDGADRGNLGFTPLFEGPCVRFSTDAHWMAVPDKKGLLVFDTSGNVPVAAGSIPRYDDFIYFDFVGSGPALVVASAGKVFLWEPPNTPEADWRQSLLYSGAAAVRDIESDAAGRRLLMLRMLESGEVEGVVYSLEARQDLVPLGEDYKWLQARFMADGSIRVWKHGSLTDIFVLPSTSMLRRSAAASLSEHCQPGKGQAWRDSPCWPSRFR